MELLIFISLLVVGVVLIGVLSRTKSEQNTQQTAPSINQVTVKNTIKVITKPTVSTPIPTPETHSIPKSGRYFYRLIDRDGQTVLAEGGQSEIARHPKFQEVCGESLSVKLPPHLQGLKVMGMCYQSEQTAEVEITKTQIPNSGSLEYTNGVFAELQRRLREKRMTVVSH